MAIREKIRANAVPILARDEVVQAVIPAQTTSQYFVLVSYWIIILTNSYRAIIVTDRRILVTHAGRFRRTPVRRVLRELPRQTQIGPPAGLWYRCDRLGERLYISKQFHRDVRTADAAAR